MKSAELLPVITKRATRPAAARTTTPALIARMIQPVLDFLRDPTGSVLLDVSAMMPKMRLGMPMTQVVIVASPDTMVRTMADVLLGTVEAPVA